MRCSNCIGTTNGACRQCLAETLKVTNRALDQVRAERDALQRTLDVRMVGLVPSVMDAPGHPRCGCGMLSQTEAGMCLSCATKATNTNDRPWPLHDVVRKLADAADHLLKDHDCDAHGYEGVCAARDAARSWLVDFDECTTTERLSAIEAFEKIIRLVEHDSPVALIADPQLASLLHEHRTKTAPVSDEAKPMSWPGLSDAARVEHLFPATRRDTYTWDSECACGHFARNHVDGKGRCVALNGHLGGDCRCVAFALPRKAAPDTSPATATQMPGKAIEVRDGHARYEVTEGGDVVAVCWSRRIAETIAESLGSTPAVVGPPTAGPSSGEAPLLADFVGDARYWLVKNGVEQTSERVTNLAYALLKTATRFAHTNTEKKR